MPYTPKFARRVLDDIQAMPPTVARRFFEEVEALCSNLMDCRKRAAAQGWWMTNHPLPVGVAYGFSFKHGERNHLGVIVFQIDANETELHVLLMRDRAI